MENQGAQQDLATPEAMTDEATAAMRGVANDSAIATEGAHRGAQPELTAHGAATEVDINAMLEAAPNSATAFGGNAMSDTALDNVTDLGGHAEQFAQLPSGQYVKQGPLGNTSNLRITRTSWKGSMADPILGEGAEREVHQPTRAEVNNAENGTCDDDQLQAIGKRNDKVGKEICYISEIEPEIKRDVVHEQILRQKQSRDHPREQDNSKNMGFSFCTPLKGNTPLALSPQSEIVATAPSWHVYSRTRRFKKQPQMGSANTEVHGTQPQLKELTEHHQPVEEAGKDTKGLGCANIEVHGTQPQLNELTE